MRLVEALPAGAAEGDWPAPITVDVPVGTWTVIRTTPERSRHLMRILIGSASIRAGDVRLLDRSVPTCSRDERARLLSSIGVLLDPSGLSSALTLQENLVAPTVFRGHLSPAAAEADAASVLGALGILHHALRLPPDVPEDVRQLAALGRALMGQPSLLLLENPLPAVNSRAAAAVWAQCRHRAPTALITAFRRDETLYALADALFMWDAAGFRRASGEGGA